MKLDLKKIPFRLNDIIWVYNAMCPGHLPAISRNETQSGNREVRQIICYLKRLYHDKVTETVILSRDLWRFKTLFSKRTMGKYMLIPKKIFIRTMISFCCQCQTSEFLPDSKFTNHMIDIAQLHRWVKTLDRIIFFIPLNQGPDCFLVTTRPHKIAGLFSSSVTKPNQINIVCDNYVLSASRHQMFWKVSHCNVSYILSTRKKKLVKGCLWWNEW